jgi:spore maturation protein CgeB
MRIFQILEATANGAVPGNQTWLRNLHEPLMELGHEVVLVSSERGRRAMESKDASARAAFSEDVLAAFRKEHAAGGIDLAFTYLMDGMIDPEVIDEIKRAGVPTCNFSCNNIHQFELVKSLSAHFDYNRHSEKHARNRFIEAGANPVWWPMASNPRYFSPRDVPRNIPVSFVGMNYASRARNIEHLLDNGIDVQVYGPGWSPGASKRMRSLTKRYVHLARAALTLNPEKQYRASVRLAELDHRRRLASRHAAHFHPPVSDEDLIQMYSRSSVSLGFLEVYDGHDPARGALQHLHLRDFEAPMSAALYCTGYSEELAEMFEPDKEVVVYRGPHELLDKVRYYLGHEAEGARIRNAGRARALKSHTYQERFRELFRLVGLGGS